MAKVYIDDSSDKIITIPFLDSAGVAEDLTLLEGYRVRLYYKDDSATFQDYVSVAESGYNSDDIGYNGDGTDGLVDIYLQRLTITSAREDSDIWAQFQVQETNANFASSQYRDLGTPKYCFTIRNTGTGTIDAS